MVLYDFNKPDIRRRVDHSFAFKYCHEDVIAVCEILKLVLATANLEKGFGKDEHLRLGDGADLDSMFDCFCCFGALELRDLTACEREDPADLHAFGVREIAFRVLALILVVIVPVSEHVHRPAFRRWLDLHNLAELPIATRVQVVNHIEWEVRHLVAQE